MLFRQANRIAPFLGLRRDVECLIDRLANEFDGGVFAPTRAFPAVNIWEDGECFYVEAEIPGVSMNDVEIYASGDELTVKGRRKPLEGDDHTYLRQERGVGEFTRMITLPADADANKVEATLKDGVLTITLPKAEEAKMRKIPVSAN